MSDSHAQNDDATEEAEFAEGLERGLEQLEAVISGDEADVLLEVLAAHLTGPVSTETNELLTEGLGVYLDTEALSLFAAIVQDPDFDHDARVDEMLEDLGQEPDTGLSSETRRWLRRASAVYGAQWTRALWCADDAPSTHDWRRVQADVLRRWSSDHPVIHLSILKFNGERFGLRMSGGSLMRLIARLMAELGRLDNAEFAERDREVFTRRLGPILEMLAPEGSVPHDDPEGQDPTDVTEQASGERA